MTTVNKYTWICPHCNKDAFKVEEGPHELTKEGKTKTIRTFWFVCGKCGFNTKKLLFGGLNRKNSLLKAYWFVKGYVYATKGCRDALKTRILKALGDDYENISDNEGMLVCLFG